jgi:pyruvate dehydrogenase E2 component (dihydrolipoamide acetyltransferase)
MLGSMRNLPLRPLKEQSSFRRIAAVAWPEPRDPHVYGALEVRAEKLEAWIEAVRKRSGEKITVTHAVTRAVAMVMAGHRDLNAIVRFGRLELRRDIDIFLQVSVEDDGKKAAKADLSGVKVCCADTKDVVSIAKEITERAAKIRAKQDPEFERTKNLLTALPGWLLRPMLGFVDFLSYTLNISPAFLGTAPDPFGGIMVTNVGVFGLTRGWAPFFPLARASMIVTLGTIERKPVVEGDEIKIGRVLYVNGTFDHRIIDGYQAALVARELKDYLENPERLDGTAMAPAPDR